MSSTDNTSYYTTDYSYEPESNSRPYLTGQDDNQMMPLLVLVMLGLGVGTVIAIMAAQRRRKPKTLIEQIEHRLNGVEKEIGKFGKMLEQRIKEMQR